MIAKKTCRIDLMVSQKEKDTIIRKAKEKNLKISEFIRLKVLGKDDM